MINKYGTEGGSVLFLVYYSGEKFLTLNYFIHTNLTIVKVVF